jgi:hypothetical protein
MRRREGKYEIWCTPTPGWFVLKKVYSTGNWINLANGTEEALEELLPHLQKDDIILSTEWKEEINLEKEV